jgi:hypothetical protein
MKLLKSETAASEVVGHAILLSITILGIGLITLYGVPAIYSLEDMANTRNVEQSFTVVDSQASRVTLGESPLQITNINLGGGTLTVEPNSTNHTSYMVVEGGNFNMTIPMGKIEYTLGDRIVAYEDGGVWSKYPSGGSVMLSPPEFHYEGVTLTLPVFNFSGSNSVGGKGSAAVSIKKNASKTQFPTGYGNRTNPVNFSLTGKVFVNITSEYYLAWADYGRGLGYIIVRKNDTTHTASMELSVVPSWLGESTPIWNPIPMRGLNTSNPEPLENFSFRIYNDKNTGPNPGDWDNSLDWDIRAVSGTKGLIFWLHSNAGNVDLTIGYTKDYTDNHVAGETWGTYTYIPQNDTNGNYYIDVDLLNKSIPLTYSNKNVGSNNAGSCILSGKKIDGIANPDYSWDNLYIRDDNANKTQPLYNITQHYVTKMMQDGDIYLYQCASGTNSPGPTSTMLLNYSTFGAITYLHVTDNSADVGIN